MGEDPKPLNRTDELLKTLIGEVRGLRNDLKGQTEKSQDDLTELKEPGFKCYECGKVFETKRSLNAHMRVHK